MTAIGLQLWTVRDRLDDLDRLFDRVSQAGIEAVEPFGLGAADQPLGDRLARASALRAAADRSGLKVLSTHTALPSVAGIGPFLEEMAALGVQTALAAVPESLNGYGRDALVSRDSVERYADSMNALCDAALQADLRIGYHNHSWEWNRISPDRLAYDYLAERLSADVVIELDVLWAEFAGQDAAAILRRLGSRVRYLHIDDASPVTNTDHQLPAGDGDVHLGDALDAMPADIEVLFIEATTPPPGMDMLELVERSAAWLRSETGRRSAS